MDSDVIINVTQNVWVTMLGRAALLEEESEETIDLEASIEVTGEWTGTMTIGVPRAVARSATATLLMCPPESASDDDLEDALGELANMIAGGLKSSVPGSSTLGLPTIVSPPGSTLEGLTTEHKVYFGFENATFVVTIHRSNTATQSGASAA